MTSTILKATVGVKTNRTSCLCGNRTLQHGTNNAKTYARTNKTFMSPPTNNWGKNEPDIVLYGNRKDIYVFITTKTKVILSHIGDLSQFSLSCPDPLAYLPIKRIKYVCIQY